MYKTMIENTDTSKHNLKLTNKEKKIYNDLHDIFGTIYPFFYGVTPVKTDELIKLISRYINQRYKLKDSFKQQIPEDIETYKEIEQKLNLNTSNSMIRHRKKVTKVMEQYNPTNDIVQEIITYDKESNAVNKKRNKRKVRDQI